METSAPPPAHGRPDSAGSAPAGFVSWGHVSLAVEDVHAAARFFTDMFDFHVSFSEMGIGSQIQRITGADGLHCDLVQMRRPDIDLTLELIAFAPADGPIPSDDLPVRPGASHLAFTVADLAAARDAVKTTGAAVLGEITEFEECRALYCRTPGGAFLELQEIKPQ